MPRSPAVSRRAAAQQQGGGGGGMSVDERRTALGLDRYDMDMGAGLPGAPPEVIRRASHMIAGALVADAAKAAVASSVQQRCCGPPGRMSTTPRLVTVAALCVLGSLLLSAGQWTNAWRTERVQHAAVAGGDGHGELVRPLRNIAERPSTPDHI